MAIEPRSWLFMPGDSDKKLSKIADCGADAVIIDLEDSVHPSAKAAARALTAEYLSGASTSSIQLWVRINPLDGSAWMEDVAAVATLPIAGLVLPKAAGPASIAMLAAHLDGIGPAASAIAIHAVATETARAVLKLTDFADQPAPRLSALSWGAEDLGAAIGAADNRGADGDFREPFRHVRTLALIAAHAAGAQAVETLYADYRDEAGLARSSAAARADGFTGRLAIHPAQVPVINAAFLPTSEETDWAGRVVAAFAEGGGAGVVGLDGKMLDRPHLIMAERTLARAASFAGK
jgi:citrate lyase subunit beta / citryl-CoA lyase